MRDLDNFSRTSFESESGLPLLESDIFFLVSSDNFIPVWRSAILRRVSSETMRPFNFSDIFFFASSGYGRNFLDNFAFVSSERGFPFGHGINYISCHVFLKSLSAGRGSGNSFSVISLSSDEYVGADAI